MASHGTPAPASPKREREPLILDAGFQLRALAPVIVSAVLYALLVLLVLFFPLSRSMAAESDMRLRILLQAQVWHIHFHLWPLLGAATLAAVYMSFYRSLRVARPIYRLHYTLQAMVAGEHPSMHMRPGEEFRFLADDVAQLNQKMKLIATRNRDILLNVNAHMKRLAERLATDEIIARADLEEVVSAVRAQLEKAPELSLPGRP